MNTSFFAQNSNSSEYFLGFVPPALISSPIPGDSLKLLQHALNRQNIPHWRFNLSEFMGTLDMTLYAVKAARTWLLKNGYATYERLKFRYTKWTFYPTPRTQEKPSSPRIIEQVEIQPVVQVEIQPGLEVKINLERKKTTTPEPIKPPDPVAPVVVFLEEEKLNYPKQLNKDELKTAKSKIKKAPVELQQDVLFELLYRITKSKVDSHIGYLISLIKMANGESPAFNYKKDKEFMASLNKPSGIIKDDPVKPYLYENNSTLWQRLINEFGDKAKVAITGHSI